MHGIHHKIMQGQQFNAYAMCQTVCSSEVKFWLVPRWAVEAAICCKCYWQRTAVTVCVYGRASYADMKEHLMQILHISLIATWCIVQLAIVMGYCTCLYVHMYIRT